MVKNVLSFFFEEAIAKDWTRCPQNMLLIKIGVALKVQ